jgi:transposase
MLRGENAKLRGEVGLVVEQLTATREQLGTVSRELTRAQRDYEHLLARFRARMAKIFGASSERLHPDQLQIDFGELEALAGELAPDPVQPHASEAPDAEDATRAPKKRGAGRRGAKTLPKDLERVIVTADLSKEDQVCHDCAQPMAKIGEDVREELDYVPASLVIKVHVRPKYACPHCRSGVHSAAPAPQVIPKALAGVGLLTQVLVSKYVDHLPLHRQESIFARQGVELSRSTMCDWIEGICERLAVLRPHLVRGVLDFDLIHSDDTRLLCLDDAEGRGKHRAALWVYRSERATLFDLRADRSRDGPSNMLVDWTGFLVSDAYSGYDELHRSGRVVEVGCMGHARRNYFEALRKTPEDASRMLAWIQRLYRVEKEAREAHLDTEARQRLRQEKSRPIVDAMKIGLADIATRALPRSLLGEAVTYMQNQWEALTRFVDNGRLPIDNMEAERAIRGVAVGRKNWLFAGSFKGGERAALIYSLIETCRQHEIDPFVYFRDVLERLPVTASDRIGDLTPWAWKAARATKG